MLSLDPANFLPEEEAIQKIRDLIDRVDVQKKLVVINRNAHPAVVMVPVDKVEEWSGEKVLMPDMAVSATTPPTMNMPSMTTPTPPSTPASGMPGMSSQASTDWMSMSAPLDGGSSSTVGSPSMPSAPTPPTPQPMGGTMAMPTADIPSMSTPGSDIPSMSTPAAPAPATPTPPADMAAPSPATPQTAPKIAEDLPDMPEDPTNSSPLA